MEENLNDLINSAFKKYAKDQIKSPNKMSEREVELLIEIKSMISPKIIKMGKFLQGFPPSKKKYDTFVEAYKTAKSSEDMIILWDDLIEVERTNSMPESLR